MTDLTAVNEETGEARKFEGDVFFSTMPIQELVRWTNFHIAEPHALWSR